MKTYILMYVTKYSSIIMQSNKLQHFKINTFNEHEHGVFLNWIFIHSVISFSENCKYPPLLVAICNQVSFNERNSPINICNMQIIELKTWMIVRIKIITVTLFTIERTLDEKSHCLHRQAAARPSSIQATMTTTTRRHLWPASRGNAIIKFKLCHCIWENLIDCHPATTTTTKTMKLGNCTVFGILYPILCWL